MIQRYVFAAALLFSEGTQAQTLETQSQALQVIADFAEKFCKEVPLTGSSQNLELNGQAKAELNNLLRKLADLGIDGAAKYSNAEYSGPLQADLVEMTKNNQTCRMQVWADLNNKMVK